MKLLVGTYAGEEEEGIHLLRLDVEEGKLEALSGVSGVENPSFLAVDGNGTRVYAVSEKEKGEIVSFDLSDLKITEISRQPTSGAAPCFVSLRKDERELFAVNYSGGSVCAFPVDGKGNIEAPASVVRHEGKSVREDRQEGPHPHSILPVPDSSFVLVPDLGTDRIYIYRSKEQTLVKHGEIVAELGAGPRHIAFHPHQPVAYIINELNSTISVYTYGRENGSFSLIQTASTLPEGFSDENTAADVHIDAAGNYLYGSNRGHDSITTYHVLDDGRLEVVGFIPTNGRTPRNFTLVPDAPLLLAANQDSDSIEVMKLGENGVPYSTGQSFGIPRPVCLIVLPE